MSKEEHCRYVVMDPADDWAPEPRRHYLFLHLHNYPGLCPCLLLLENVQIHFIAVKIGIIRRANSQIEPERLSLKNAHSVPHHRHPVKRRLPVEQDDVPLSQLAFYGPAGLYSLAVLLRILGSHLYPPAVRSDYIVYPSHIPAEAVSGFRSPRHHFPNLCNIEG